MQKSFRLIILTSLLISVVLVLAISMSQSSVGKPLYLGYEQGGVQPPPPPNPNLSTMKGRCKKIFGGNTGISESYICSPTGSGALCTTFDCSDIVKTHLECNKDKQCKPVSGKGADLCGTGSKGSCTRTEHLACNDKNQCYLDKTSGGYDQCSTVKQPCF